MSNKTKYPALLLLLPLMLMLLVFYSNTSEHLYAVVGLAQNVASAMTSQKRYAIESANRNASTMVSPNGYATSVATQKPGDDMTSVPICTSRERLDYIRRQIARHYKARRRQRLNIIVNDKRRIAFCRIAKCASSTLDQFMALVGGNYTARDLQWQRFWLNHVRKQFGLRVVKERSLHTIAGYRKFVVIRHPLDRFVSAFHDKILTQRNPAGVDGPFRRAMMKYLNGAFVNATEFQRFTKAVLSGHNNEHWHPLADGCRFDQVDYDDVIRLESFRHDLEPMVTGYLALNWSSVLQVSHNMKRQKSSGDDVAMSVKPKHLSLFSEISKNELMQLKDYYRNDLELLGYDFDVNTLTTSCKIVSSGGRICC